MLVLNPKIIRRILTKVNLPSLNCIKTFCPVNKLVFVQINKRNDTLLEFHSYGKKLFYLLMNSYRTKILSEILFVSSSGHGAANKGVEKGVNRHSSKEKNNNGHLF